MDQRAEIREFLASRRARLAPQQAGLPTYGGNRRVPGLRREEVALLAGVSVDYYTQIERGNLGGVSDNVLHALAGRCSWTRPSTRICSTWPAPPRPLRPARGDQPVPSGSGPASSGSWTP